MAPAAAYQHDELDRPYRATLLDGSTWTWGRNARGEITSATRKLPGEIEVPALGADYDFDDIGNRKSATSPILGNFTYTPNSVNQYTAIATNDTRTVLGTAPVSPPITVNGASAARQGNLFTAPLTGNNANPNVPVWLTAAVSDGTTTQTRHTWLPEACTAPTYDDDGNLTNDGQWSYLWDAENRLVEMETTPAAVQVGRPYRKLTFAYDWTGRRLARTIYGPNAAILSATKWLYDGWNPVAKFSAETTGQTLVRTYLWGMDLSGTMQGAGGVGGLLSVSLITNNTITHNFLPSYDGNGNIVAWTASGSTAPACLREYDSFGNILIEHGTPPCAIGFSTKPEDPETGLLYYGYRYLSPLLGRWLSQDPIAEEGGVNLYGFIGNNGMGQWDYLGMIGTAEVDSIGLVQMRATMWVRFVCCEGKTAEEKQEWRRQFKQNVEDIYNYFYGVRLDLTVVNGPDWNDDSITPAPDIAVFELEDEEIADRLRINLVTVDCRIGKYDDVYGGMGDLNNRILLGWDHNARTQAHEVLHVFGLDDEGMTGISVGRTPHRIQPLRNNQINHYPDTDFITTTVIRPKDIRDILNIDWEDSKTGGKPHPKIKGDGAPSEDWVRIVRMRSELRKRIDQHEQTHGKISVEDRRRITRDVIKEFTSAP